MSITATFSTKSPKAGLDLLLIPVFSNGVQAELKRRQADYGGSLLKSALDFSGEHGQTALIYPDKRSIKRIQLIGLGRRDKSSSEKIRVAISKGADLARTSKAKNVGCLVPAGAKDAETFVEAATEGFVLAAYRYDRYRPNAERAGAIKLTLFGPGLKASAAGAAVKRGATIAESTNFARDLVNTPVRDLTARDLANQAKASAKKHGYTATVWGIKQIERNQFGGLLAVNLGSPDEPTFTILEWKPKNAINSQPLVFVGKGVVFDTGGLSLKPTKNSMDRMKYDMAGAAAAIGATEAIARLKLPVHLITLVPATDNRPGQNAYVPSDVIKMHSGHTVEVLNTDAEGRMILADALSWAQRYKPELVIDLATLTGAQVVALGSLAAAIMTNEGPGDARRISRFVKSGHETGDRVAPLPMYDEYAELLKSDVADMKNVGGREAGSITAGKFLEHFTDYPWVHLDIAGPSSLDKNVGYRRKGGTGFGVRLLTQFVRNYVDQATK